MGALRPNHIGKDSTFSPLGNENTLIPPKIFVRNLLSPRLSNSQSFPQGYPKSFPQLCSQLYAQTLWITNSDPWNGIAVKE
jgi:hypothetical protein